MRKYLWVSVGFIPLFYSDTLNSLCLSLQELFSRPWFPFSSRLNSFLCFLILWKLTLWSGLSSSRLYMQIQGCSCAAFLFSHTWTASALQISWLPIFTFCLVNTILPAALHCVPQEQPSTAHALPRRRCRPVAIGTACQVAVSYHVCCLRVSSPHASGKVLPTTSISQQFALELNWCLSALENVFRLGRVLAEWGHGNCSQSFCGGFTKVKVEKGMWRGSWIWYPPRRHLVAAGMPCLRCMGF